jgi:hypothetical protein
MSVSGLEKQGKTHFALTAPGPIAYFGLDIGTEGVIGKFVTNKTIWAMEIIVPMDGVAATETWNKFYSTYEAVLNMNDIRTIILDTATEAWELLRLARFGKLTQVMPHHYGPVNAEYRKLIRAAYMSDKNLILLHKMKSVYVNDKRTRDYERAGFSDTGFLVQVNCQIYRDDDGIFNLYVVDCRQNSELMGEVLSGEMCNFPMLASLVLSGKIGRAHV